MRLSLLATTFLAAPVLLAGCAHNQPLPVAPVEAAPVTEAEAAPQPEAPKPVYGTYGFDTAGMDTAIKPGDDSYNYANGTWAKNTAIPSDKSNYGAFNILADNAQKQTQEILEGVKSDPNSKIGTAYSTYLDTATIDAKGLAPAKAWIDQIKGLSSKAGYPALIAAA